VSKPPFNFALCHLHNPPGPDGKPRPAPPSLGDIAAAAHTSKFPLVSYDLRSTKWRVHGRGAANPVASRSFSSEVDAVEYLCTFPFYVAKYDDKLAVKDFVKHNTSPP
jgi:hypothetical protein